MRRNRTTRYETEGDTVAFIFLPGVLDEIYHQLRNNECLFPSQEQLYLRSARNVNVKKFHEVFF